MFYYYKKMESHYEYGYLTYPSHLPMNYDYLFLAKVDLNQHIYYILYELSLIYLTNPVYQTLELFPIFTILVTVLGWTALYILSLANYLIISLGKKGLHILRLMYYQKALHKPCASVNSFLPPGFERVHLATSSWTLHNRWERDFYMNSNYSF